MPLQTKEKILLSRRAILKSLAFSPWVLKPASLYGSWLPGEKLLLPADGIATGSAHLPFAEAHLTPHYPAKSPLDDILRLVPPGADDYVTEKYAFEVGLLLEQWSTALLGKDRGHTQLAAFVDPSMEATSFRPTDEIKLRTGSGIDSVRRHFSPALLRGREQFLAEMREWLEPLAEITTAEFEITSFDEQAGTPSTFRLAIQYDLVAIRKDGRREERVGQWLTGWKQGAEGNWSAHRWTAASETATSTHGPGFVDVTAQYLGKVQSYSAQMLRGTDDWRTVLDGACGIDVYGNNGLASGDFDNDGFDDLYICQPAGLPNRLYKNNGDGTFEDVTDKAGVGVLDNTACALFADFQNRGLQDLLVVCGSGPLLFVNQGDGTFAVKLDAFRFEQPPQGSFTHASLSDYDRDGRLDIYFCVYSYYLGLDQYHYPVPYFDARNGPPNFLMHNQGDGTFVDRTAASGLNAENNRYSFACAWGESGPTHLPDLYVANDFGRNNLYRNNGDGTFTSVSSDAHVEDVAAGMSAAWSDFENDGKQDIYVANMWSAAGQRVSSQNQFHQKSAPALRAFYQRHARGNTLYRNRGNGDFENVSDRAGVAKGRWAWSSDFWDFDHDGYQDLYVTNGYISSPGSETPPRQHDLGSFFWRQVVARSPDDATPTQAYEHGWQALNELIRSDTSWNGHERNVVFANNRDGTFSEASGVVGLDFIEDSRSFVLADLDHDGRLEVILKSRNAPQLRILHNEIEGIGQSVSFRLRGKKSNRDGIGTAITVEAGSLHQTKYLQAGSGFLAQHAKEVFFGVADWTGPLRVTLVWPSGQSQAFEDVPANHRIQVEEESPTFQAVPFTTIRPAPSAAAKLVIPPVTPASIETWLIEPLKAPAFSLPGLHEEIQELQHFRGSNLLLLFWTMDSSACQQGLASFEHHRSRLTASGLQLLAINVDPATEVAKARAAVQRQKLSFPVAFATGEVAGIYNIIYRYLFDRRRDLPLPSSMLLDREGMIVKLYQGVVDPLTVLSDSRSIPSTPAARLQMALPFRGTFYQGGSRRNDFTYGVAMFQHGYLDPAADSFQQVILAKPGDPEGYYNLGTLSLRRNDFPAARRYLEQTLKLRPDYPEAWNNLGMMAAQQGHADEAVQAFQRSLQLRPTFAVALLNLGNVYRRQGNYGLAQQSLQQAIELQPDDADTNYSMGMLYAQKTQLQDASEYLKKAIAARTNYPEAMNNLGIIYVREQQYAEAESTFKSCIAMSPAFDQAYLNLARLYALQHDLARATDVVQTLLKLQPENQNAQQALRLFGVNQ